MNKTLRMWLPPRRPVEHRDVPYADFYLGRLSGAVLVWLAKRALKRGDVHEFNHCSAVIAVGNTDGDHFNCQLRTPVPLAPANFEIHIKEKA